MRNVPHDGKEFLPGLYEFHLVQSSENEPLQVKFVDYHNYQEKNAEV